MRHTPAVLAALAAATLAAGCSSSHTTQPRASALGTMTAVVRGTGWSAVDSLHVPDARAVMEDYGGTAQTLTLFGPRLPKGGDTLYSAIALSLGEARTGAFVLTDFPHSATWRFDRAHPADTVTTTWSTDASHVGALSVTALDTGGKRVKGTFSFTGFDADSGTVTVTSGTFDLPYVVMRLPAPARAGTASRLWLSRQEPAAVRARRP